MTNINLKPPTVRRNAIGNAHHRLQMLDNEKSSSYSVIESPNTPIWSPEIPNYNRPSTIQAHSPSSISPTPISPRTRLSNAPSTPMESLLSISAPSTGNASTTAPNATPSSSNATTNTEAVTKLAEALDDFLGDVERKFKGISEEILARLDEMAERCDRLEGELLRKETGPTADGGKV